jgi:hypothetical protein
VKDAIIIRYDAPAVIGIGDVDELRARDGLLPLVKHDEMPSAPSLLDASRQRTVAIQQGRQNGPQDRKGSFRRFDSWPFSEATESSVLLK